MLTASLGYTGRPYAARGGERHDVGDGRRLTVREIALEARCDVSAVYARLAKGWTGRKLLVPTRRKLFDCGGGRMLTIKEIMLQTGLGESAVRTRISRGVKGSALLRRERRNLAAPRSSTMVIACRLADQFPDRLPTTREIRRIYPMCDQTAERWRTALRAARGGAA